MKQSKIAIIGAGTVGSTTAYTLKMHNVASKILLIDINELKCKGEVDDLSDAISMVDNSLIAMGTLQEAGQADIAIIAAGIPQKPGQPRTELLQTNLAVVETILKGMKPLNPQLLIIVVTNPVDTLTYFCQQKAGISRNQIFGSGTLLDTQRLKHAISSNIAIAAQSIDLTIVGEHGDSQVVAWSCARIAHMPLMQFPTISLSELQKIAHTTQNKAYDIIACKGSTAYGVASCVATYCHALLYDARQIIPVSCYSQEFEVCMSMPAVLGSKGISQIFMPPLNNDEQEKLQQSIFVLKNAINQLF